MYSTSIKVAILNENSEKYLFFNTKTNKGKLGFIVEIMKYARWRHKSEISKRKILYLHYYSTSRDDLGVKISSVVNLSSSKIRI